MAFDLRRRRVELAILPVALVCRMIVDLVRLCLFLFRVRVMADSLAVVCLFLLTASDFRLASAAGSSAARSSPSAAAVADLICSGIFDPGSCSIGLWTAPADFVAAADFGPVRRSCFAIVAVADLVGPARRHRLLVAADSSVASAVEAVLA